MAPLDQFSHRVAMSVFLDVCLRHQKRLTPQKKIPPLNFFYSIFFYPKTKNFLDPLIFFMEWKKKIIKIFWNPSPPPQKNGTCDT